ncbi:MAG: PIN/TRAM domain-containing protein [Planctomycetota bacterium]|nr:MAG: PIN/TRAM domain-containing protein [Planctomycetota bacterium]
MARSKTPATPTDDAAAGRGALLRLLRILLIAVIILVTFFYVLDIGQNPQQIGDWEINLVTGWPWVLLFGLTLAFGVIAIDVLTPEKKIATVSGVFFGIVAGVAAAIALSFLLDRIAEVYEITGSRIIDTIKILIGIATVYLAVSIVLQTQDQFRLVIPYVEFARQVRGPRPLILDSAALIDGRILDVCRTGLIQAPIVIPRFVVDELQTLADSGDGLKRTRGRRGLEIVSRLQREALLDVSVDESDAAGAGADQMLIDLAARLPGTVVTTDSALARVAGIKGVSAVNLNELASAMRLAVAPGDRLEVRLVRPGEQPGQAVGFLDDGTMVVADDGADLIGRTAALRVTSSLQTNAGRMIFARPTDAPAADAPPATPTTDTGAQPEREASPDGSAASRRRDPRKTRARNPRR